jgi:plasmid maintenance system antidote protein VapI
MDQYGLTRADMVPILGAPSRVNEVLRGKKGLSMAMVQRPRARFRVSADLLLVLARRSRRKPSQTAMNNHGSAIDKDCPPPHSATSKARNP